MLTLDGVCVYTAESQPDIGDHLVDRTGDLGTVSEVERDPQGKVSAVTIRWRTRVTVRHPIASLTWDHIQDVFWADSLDKARRAASLTSLAAKEGWNDAS